MEIINFNLFMSLLNFMNSERFAKANIDHFMRKCYVKNKNGF